jgi:hypothetical protein
MLNEQGQRELVYVAKITDIIPIQGADNIELVVINDGWRCIAKKGEFQKGDLAVYFEIDSKLPEDAEWAAFLAPKHYKVKTMKLGKFGVISQGLALPASAFGWELTTTGQFAGDAPVIKTPDNKIYAEGDFLTEALKVKYSVQEDNVRKSNVDKYKAMAQRNGKLFSKQPFRWLMKRTWGKKLLFVFFGKKRDSQTAFPTKFPYVRKTDQERCENMTWVLKDKTPFIVTEKCDGSSGTYILERKRFGKFEFYVCSRNVRQLDEKQKCYYDENHYWDVAKRYDIETKMTKYMKEHPELQYLCWQGEVCGPAIQKNPHGLKENHLFLFHCIDSEKGKWDIREAVKLWESYGMEHVPIIMEDYILPNDFDEFKESAEGFYDSSVTGDKNKRAREGYVYYKTDDPNFSFKNVSRSYLLKHNN